VGSFLDVSRAFVSSGLPESAPAGDDMGSRMDESPNPGEYEEPEGGGVRLGHFRHPDGKKDYRGPRRGDGWRCSKSRRKQIIIMPVSHEMPVVKIWMCR
jgi:hypothetical protein